MTDNTLPKGFDQKTGPAAFDTPEPALENEGADTAQIAELSARLQVIEGELKDAKDQTLRAMADAENTRKRAERDRDDAGKYAISNFARGLLNVADNFRRAIESIPADLHDDERIKNLITGIEATEKELLASFDRVGIKPIPAMDQPFNANLHEVMFESPGTGKAAGTVVQVIETGYTIHDRLLRPARVGVAKAEPGAPANNHNIDTQA